MEFDYVIENNLETLIEVRDKNSADIFVPALLESGERMCVSSDAIIVLLKGDNLRYPKIGHLRWNKFVDKRSEWPLKDAVSKSFINIIAMFTVEKHA